MNKAEQEARRIEQHLNAVRYGVGVLEQGIAGDSRLTGNEECIRVRVVDPKEFAAPYQGHKYDEVIDFRASVREVIHKEQLRSTNRLYSELFNALCGDQRRKSRLLLLCAR